MFARVVGASPSAEIGNHPAVARVPTWPAARGSNSRIKERTNEKQKHRQQRLCAGPFTARRQNGTGGTGPGRKRGHGRKRQASRSRALLLQHAGALPSNLFGRLSFGMRARALTACTAALGRCVVPPEITSTHPAARRASRRHKGRKHRMLKALYSVQRASRVRRAPGLRLRGALGCV